MSMTQAEVDALPRLEFSPSAYESVRKLKCPQCNGRLTPQNVTYFSFDDISRRGVERTKIIPSAGCDPCSIIYRFDENPIVVRDTW